MQNLGQAGPKLCFFYSSPALNLHQKVFTKLHNSSFKYTIFQLQTPCVHTGAQFALTRHQSSPMSKTDLRSCVQITIKRVTLVNLYHVNRWVTHKNFLLQSWTLHKSADCRWISITILCVSFTSSATVGSLEQVQLCIGGLTNQQTISPASNAQKSVLSWSILLYPES